MFFPDVIEGHEASDQKIGDPFDVFFGSLSDVDVVGHGIFYMKESSY